MLKYIIKRVIYIIPTIALVAVMVFFLIHMIPGDPALVILGSDASEEEVAKAYRDNAKKYHPDV